MSAWRVRRPRRLAIVAIAVVAVIVVAAVVFLSQRNRATPVPLRAAVNHYRGAVEKRDSTTVVETVAPTVATSAAATSGTRSRSAVASKPNPHATAPRAVEIRPRPGVYRYNTQGYESVPRLGARRNYPAQTTATATYEKGCNWGLRVDLIAEHTDGYELCTTATGMTWRRLSIAISWFGIHRTLAFDCQGVDLIAMGATPGSTRQGSCHGDGGSTAMQLTQRAPEVLTIGGGSVRAVHVDLLMTISGEFQGTGNYSFWFEPASGLLLHMIRSVDAEGSTPLGRQQYVEHHESALVDLSPST